MNKFKAWLITKLGGNLYPINTDKLIEKQYIGSPTILYNEVIMPSNYSHEILNSFTLEDQERSIVVQLMRDLTDTIINNHLYSYKKEDLGNGNIKHRIRLSIYNEKK